MGETIVNEVLIGGRWEPAAGGTYPVIDPATEEVVGQAPEASVAQARAAARAARDAFERGPWPHMPPAERGACLREAAARFRDAAPRLVDLAIAETGSLRAVAESQQVGAVALRLAKYARVGRPDDRQRRAAARDAPGDWPSGWRCANPSASSPASRRTISP